MAKIVKKSKTKSIKNSEHIKNIIRSEDEENGIAANIINTVDIPLLLLDGNLCVVEANRSFYDFFNVSPEETIGTLIYDLGNNHKVIQSNIRDISKRKDKESGLERTRKELEVIKDSADEVSEFAVNIINTVREPLLILNKELRVVNASRSFYDFFKVSPEETIGTLIYDLGNHQWDIPKLRELLETILPDKTTFDNYEVEHDFSTIGKRIMLLNARQIERANEKEKIILLAIEDITKRKVKEDGLEKTRKELVVIKKSADEVSEFAENIINTVREPLLLLDKELRVVKASHSFYDYFKVKAKETIGTLIYDLGNHQWDIPKLRELLETILPKKTTFDNYEVEHDFSTIGKRVMLLNARKIRRGIGKEQIILLAIEDITKRKEIEAGLEKTRIELEVIKELADEVSEFTENIINTVREPLLVLDKELRVVKASRSFYDFFKVNSTETIGKLIYDLGNQQWNIPKLRELLETILPEKTSFDNYEVKHDFSTIGERIMLLNARNIKRGTGKEQIILLAIEDITDRKNNENELSKAKTEAERANIAKSEFLSRMSHELRTPLNSILGFAQLMEMDDLNPIHKKGVKQILKSGKHLLELINEVLDVAKIEAGRLTISPEPVEILGIIMETIDIVSNLAEENKVKLELVKPAEEKILVKADHQRLKQVLLNLLNNAVKYNKVNGSVKVVCEIKKMNDAKGRIKNGKERIVDTVRINVVDTGKGIAQEYIEKLFNPFERIGAERTQTEGTGLGLAISKKLVEAMGGKIGVESIMGSGSTFWIELPQTESQIVQLEQSICVLKSDVNIPELSGTILYIEDNISNIQLVEQILETHRPSIRLITNMNGKNAVPFAVDFKPNLILLDLDLPDIHGGKVIKLLHENSLTADIPVIILSADAMTKQIESLLKFGAKDYLTKPIDVKQFLMVIDESMVEEKKKK